MEVKLIRSMKEVLQLLTEGYVLSEPSMYSSRPRCELTLPMNLEVQYETVGMAWYVFEEIIKRIAEKKMEMGNPLFDLRKIQVQEPECGVAWVIIHASNASALRWQVTAQGLYTEAMKNVVANLDADEIEQDDELTPYASEEARISRYKIIASAMVDVLLEGEDGDADE